MYWEDIGSLQDRSRTGGVLRALAVVFAVIAVGCMIAAIVGMVTGRPGDKAGWLLRAIAVGSFTAAVVLNAIAH
jgi:hypothetical protein